MTAETAQQGNGLKTVIDTVVAPKEACEALRDTPTWGWALIILCVLFIVGYELQRPATLHASVGTIQHMIATNPMMANVSDEQKTQMLEKAQHPDMLSTVLGPVWALLSYLIGILVNATILLVANASGGKARFSNLWAASVNIAVPTLGLPAIVLGLICILRGPDNFNATSDIIKALPNVGMIAPGLGGIPGGILACLNVFALWGLFLNMQILRWTAGLTGAVVWLVPALITLLSALIGGWFLSFAG